jgi:tight adherence protein C
MTTMLFAIGVVMVGVTGRLVVHALVVPRLAIKQHLREIQDYGFEQPREQEAMTSSERFAAAFKQAAGQIGRTMMRRFPAISALSPSELSAAGFYDVKVEVVHGYRTLAAIGLPTLIFLLLAASGPVSGLKILLVAVSALAGWMIPSFLVRKRGAGRLTEIDRRLPELIDLLIATVEAGMGFTAALGLVAERFEGPLGEELKLTMKQQSLGMSIAEAMNEMVERCDTPSVRAFIRTAARGETLGVSIGPVLRELSADQRRRHRMAARERMQKAPIKLIFPLMFLIFPALMIVLMFPAVYSISHNLSGIF